MNIFTNIFSNAEWENYPADGTLGKKSEDDVLLSFFSLKKLKMKPFPYPRYVPLKSIVDQLHKIDEERLSE